MMRLSIASLSVLVALGSNCSAQPDKTVHEPQERCSRQAAQTFEERGGNVASTKDGQILANYESHYSVGQNKCFYLEISTTIQRKSLQLYDLNENKQFGLFQEKKGE